MPRLTSRAVSVAIEMPRSASIGAGSIKAGSVRTAPGPACAGSLARTAKPTQPFSLQEYLFPDIADPRVFPVRIDVGRVALHAGARIETLARTCERRLVLVAPSVRGRGLKRPLRDALEVFVVVLPSGRKRLFVQCQNKGKRAWKMHGDTGSMDVREARSGAAGMLAANRRGEREPLQPDDMTPTPVLGKLCPIKLCSIILRNLKLTAIKTVTSCCESGTVGDEPP